MRFSHFFIDRPIFAAVISILLTLVGAIAYRALPIAEYPEIAPPTVVVRATFAGASAEVIAQTVAAPIEQEINGVDDMIYLVSQSTGDGALEINVVFKPGTNVDQAQVLVQNRVSVALPRLPEEVQRIGVTVREASPDLMLVIHLPSPDDSLDQQYISNYATINVKDSLPACRCRRRRVFGARDYSMRSTDPPLRARGPPPATWWRRARNQRAGGGRRHQPAAGDSPGAFQVAVRRSTGCRTPISSRRSRRHRPGRPVTRVRDIARGLGSQDYTRNAYLDTKVATAISIFSARLNALATAAAVISTMDSS